jgi:hypothetical protein
MLSLSLCPKVIPICGFHCIKKMVGKKPAFIFKGQNIYILIDPKGFTKLFANQKNEIKMIF